MNREQWNTKRGESADMPAQRSTNSLRPQHPQSPPTASAASRSDYEVLSCCEWVNLEKVGVGDTATK